MLTTNRVRRLEVNENQLNILPAKCGAVRYSLNNTTEDVLANRTNRGSSYLAFDLGAESGRAVLAELHSGIITTKELRRFRNQPLESGSTLRWNVDSLWSELRGALNSVEGMKLAGIGVDAWGVDYALLGDHGQLLENPYHYRDRRTVGTTDEVFRKVPKEEIYRATGIQFMPINTLYQLYAAQRDTPSIVRSARQMLTIPDLFNYWLSGKAVCEFTNATTTQMVDATRRVWARDLMQQLGLRADLPCPIVEPGTVIGSLLNGIASNSLVAGTPVVAPACHDTGSAVAAITARDGTAFLSSGTWSLIGTELDAPVLTPEALKLNFTNEGGVNGTTRLLKNVMGLWILQGCRACWSDQGKSCSYDALIELANREPAFAHLVNPDDERFLRSTEMLGAIDQFCSGTQQPTPSTPGAYVRCILESLAMKYRLTIRNLEKVCGQRIEQVRVVGGGSKNRALNQFTADATGRKVIAGPAEAASLGNIAIQILATREASSLEEVRAMIDRSFPAEIFEPMDTDKWEPHFHRFEQYCEMTYA